MGPYETFLRGLVPPTMRGKTITKIVTTIGSTLDACNEAGQAALRAGHIETTPLDGIEPHARARLLDRWPGETLEQLRYRASKAWEFWTTLHRRRTNERASGLETLLRDALKLSNVWVYDQANDGWFNAPLIVGCDSNAENASRQNVVIGQPHPWTRPVVGPGLVIGPNLLVGITMLGDELRFLRSLYRKHRPANLIGVDAWVILDSTPPEDLVNYHDAGEVVRFPLMVSLVGYAEGGATHGMVVGPNMIVGKEWT